MLNPNESMQRPKNDGAVARQSEEARSKRPMTSPWAAAGARREATAAGKLRIVLMPKAKGIAATTISTADSLIHKSNAAKAKATLPTMISASALKYRQRNGSNKAELAVTKAASNELK
mmetsp:Transcript_62800/g.124123  ORF Transcript_62800/g.124123 Transcript_62800/m.124123 type:complete len:118 (-) Transcript_62800:215-568(-)